VVVVVVVVVVVSNNGVMLWEYAKTTLSLMVELSRVPPLRGTLPLLLLKALLNVILWLFANIQEEDLAQIATRLLGGQIVALEYYVALWIILCSVCCCAF